MGFRFIPNVLFSSLATNAKYTKLLTFVILLKFQLYFENYAMVAYRKG